MIKQVQHQRRTERVMALRLITRVLMIPQLLHTGLLQRTAMVHTLFVNETPLDPLIHVFNITFHNLGLSYLPVVTIQTLLRDRDLRDLTASVAPPAKCKPKISQPVSSRRSELQFRRNYFTLNDPSSNTSICIERINMRTSTPPPRNPQPQLTFLYFVVSMAALGQYPQK